MELGGNYIFLVDEDVFYNLKFVLSSAYMSTNEKPNQTTKATETVIFLTVFEMKFLESTTRWRCDCTAGSLYFYNKSTSTFGGNTAGWLNY